MGRAEGERLWGQRAGKEPALWRQCQQEVPGRKDECFMPGPRDPVGGAGCPSGALQWDGACFSELSLPGGGSEPFSQRKVTRMEDGIPELGHEGP